MNDFKEIEHGLNCLNAARFSSPGARLSSITDSKFPGLKDELDNYFDNALPNFRSNTYLTCMSEHDDDEDAIGRLSLWRAYGSASGVALVLNRRVFIEPSDALKAYTSPVLYADEKKFADCYNEVLSNIEKNWEFFQTIPRHALLWHLYEVYSAAILCTKHPGFREEREWRVVYQPWDQSSSLMLEQIESINGIPQMVCKIPLKNVPQRGLDGIEIPQLVDRVIIGPTQYPDVMKDAFVSALSSAGLSDAANRVWVSDIPLRR